MAAVRATTTATTGTSAPTPAATAMPVVMVGSAATAMPVATVGSAATGLTGGDPTARRRGGRPRPSSSVRQGDLVRFRPAPQRAPLGSGDGLHQELDLVQIAAAVGGDTRRDLGGA